MADSTYAVNDASLPDLVHTLESMDKKLVCLDDHWPYYVTCGEKAAIDVPVIAVYDFSGIEFLNCISKLKDIFREDGYHAVAVSNTCRGLAAEIEYMPWDESEYISLEHIKQISILAFILRLHSQLTKHPACDILIYGN